MATEERSAGFVIYRMAQAQRLYLLLDYGRHWDYAKGHVEPAETDVAAALRELREETGITGAKVIPDFAREISYFFQHRKRGLIHKTVVYFLAQAPTADVTLSREHVGYVYLPYPQALERVTFPTAKEILRVAEEFLDTRDQAQSTPDSLS